MVVDQLAQLLASASDASTIVIAVILYRLHARVNVLEIKTGIKNIGDILD